MQVMRVQDIRSLRQTWEKLAVDRPFCSPNWMINWSDQFCQSCQPFVVAVYDKGQPMAIAPFHSHTSRIGAERLEFLGTGKVCSEFIGILATPDYEEAATEYLSQWMLEAASGVHGEENKWERLDLESVPVQDAATDLFCKKLADQGAQIKEGESASCWRLLLNSNIDDWLGGLNKSVRRKLRQLDQQYIRTGRAHYSIVTQAAEKRVVLQKLIDLHSQRRQQLGESGCFSTPGFSEFIEAATLDDSPENSVRLSTVKLDETTIATGLCLESRQGLYVYQCGIAVPDESTRDLAATNPGWLLNLCHIQYAYQKQLKFVDYLRGDEQYKHQLGAVSSAPRYLMAVPPISSAKLRQQIWTVAQAAKGIGKVIANRVHLH